MGVLETFEPTRLPLFKLIIHIVQIVLSLTIWILEIVVFRDSEATINGNNGWTFAVCFLSIPAWIYLIGTPRFPRTQRLANPYVMAVVDGLFCVIWLTAFATQAAYNTANSCGKACSSSKAIVALGFFEFVLFGASTFLSIYTVQYYKWNDRLPGYPTERPGGVSQNIDPDKAAFSMAPHEEEAYAHIPMDDHDRDHEHDVPMHVNDPYASAAAPQDHGSPYADDGVHGGGGGGYNGGSVGASGFGAENPFRTRMDNNPFEEEDTSYRPHTALSSHHPGASGLSGSMYAPPAAHDDYDDEHHRPAQFPAANYDRVGRFGQPE